jgi:hypothetical protein
VRPVSSKPPLGTFGPKGLVCHPPTESRTTSMPYSYSPAYYPVSQGGALTTSDFRELSARLSSLACEMPTCRGRILSVLEGILRATAVLSVAILTMAILSRCSRVSEEQVSE